MGFEVNDMYAVVVHDVKNQLAELALLLNTRGDAQQEMGIAMNAARRLSELLLVQRHDAEMLEVNIDSADPADTLNMLVAEYRDLFPNINLSVDVTEAPGFGFFDDALVRLALANAVHNACRFAKSKVRLTARKDGAMLVFEIADDGPGFPVEMLERDGNLPARASMHGTGMGLYLARKIACMHTLDGQQGRIELVNRDGGVFRMILP
jgi:signal transduction histidine kinase